MKLYLSAGMLLLVNIWSITVTLPLKQTEETQVSANTLTTAFKKAREKCGIKWEPGTAPTFHEQRSLSERLYREQGLDTQKLLGHKSRKMTDRYNDDRGKDWIIVDIKTA